MTEETTFQRKVREARERKEREAALVATQQSHAAAPITSTEFDADLIPEEQYERSDEDKQMDAAIESIDILDAYNRWCGKEVDKKTINRTEGVMVSCPTPDHRDSNPSAWINRDKQTWFCGGCQIGGDKYDIAAFHFGYPVPGYKDGARFHELRREMADSMGFTFTKLPGGVTVVSGPSEDDSDGTVAPSSPASLKVVAPEPDSTPEEVDDSNVYEMFEDDDNILLPSLDWRPIVPEDTFLHAYMKATSLDDVPEEYHFFNGLLALGFALGRDVRLYDLIPVHGNLFVCTLGHSGSGKSKARYHLDRLLAQALPHDWSDPNSKGVRKVSAPGSAEVLIHNFQKPVPDPATPKTIAYYAPVRGIIDFNELSALVARTGRAGNAIIPALMQFYDMEQLISTSSMTTGAKEAHQPFASALTTTQPRALKGLLTKQDASSGFLNRWLFVTGKDKKKFAIGGVSIDITPAVEPLQEILAWASTFSYDEMIQWSPEAAEKFTVFFHSQIDPDKKRSQNDLITRIDLLMKKLILLFTANRKLKVVPVEAVDDAIACYPYLIESYGVPAEQLGSTLTSEVTDAIMSVARKQFEKDGKGVTLRQIAKTLWRRKYPNDLILKSCDALVKLGYLQVEPPKAGQIGRPTVRYKYVA